MAEDFLRFCEVARTELPPGYSIHTYGDIYDADGNYVDTVYLNSGVYYFHDEDIEWPEGYEPKDAFMDDYDYLNPT